ncbi:MAG: UbiD family decarboxylase [Oscillospiraceae bacterium]
MISRDLHDHIKALEAKGLLCRITRPINKDTELHPLVRLQFNALPESERKAFLFENVIDSKGNKYDFPVLVGGVAASREIYAVGMGCSVEEISAKWALASSNPIPPTVVENAKVQEVVRYIDESDPAKRHGFDLFPIPISTPGWDTAPYLTCAQWVSQDPITGDKNVGNYRGHIKSPTRTGIKLLGPQQDIYKHMQNAMKLGQPLDVAVVIGGPPGLTHASASKLPAGVDEIAVAGALIGESIPVVKCKTSNLMVPANAEVIVEGKIRFDYLEPEGPFGDFHGYMHPVEYEVCMEVTCITYRKDAIWVSLISQLAPSESSVIRGMSTNALLLKHLRTSMGVTSVKDAICFEAMVGLRRLVILQMDHPILDQTTRALMGAGTFMSMGAKIVIAVDSDIDITDLTSVMWAVGMRCIPHKDVQIVHGLKKGSLPPFRELDENGIVIDAGRGDEESLLLIDATLKGRAFPPISLPKKEYMEKAIGIWNELGLPELHLHTPWFGYDLGGWSKILEDQADEAAKGNYYSNDGYYKALRKELDTY